jgi:hypothetical protein
MSNRRQGATDLQPISNHNRGQSPRGMSADLRNDFNERLERSEELRILLEFLILGLCWLLLPQ